MEAYPAAVSFQWFFNSSEYEEWKGHEEFSQTGLKSELEFLPKSSKDYGSLFCIGENAIGRQEEACVFQVKNFPDFWISGSCFRLCQRGSPPPWPPARLSTRPSPPSKSSVRKVKVFLGHFVVNQVSSYQDLTAACLPTSSLSSMMLRKWNSSRKSPTKCQYLRCLHIS